MNEVGQSFKRQKVTHKETISDFVMCHLGISMVGSYRTSLPSIVIHYTLNSHFKPKAAHSQPLESA